MSHAEIQKIEAEMMELSKKLNALRAEALGPEIPDYTFTTLEGPTTLKKLFGDRKELLVIHNMGQGCRYCTLWADGFNGFLPHLESAMSVVLASKDEPKTQRLFANSRGWRFRMVSHAGSPYLKEQNVVPDAENYPGAVVYQLNDKGQIRIKNRTVFGPNDAFCSFWNLIGMAGLDEETWHAQYNYWKRPAKLDDGGSGLAD